jgi:membrane protease YdiL (CAAX protease family)
VTPTATPFIAEYVGLPGGYFILLHAGLIPWSTYRARRRLTGRPTLPPRAKHLTSTLLVQVVLLGLALLIARVCGIGLFPPLWPGPLHLAVGLAVLAVMLAAMVPLWKRAVAKGDRRLYFFMPEGRGEKALWVGVAAAAGVGEETTYRGVLYALFLNLAGRWWIAALLSALVFGAAHAFQSRRSMAIIFCFSLIFQTLVLWTGALYVSMLIHVLYDVVAGFTYSRLGREMGYRAEAGPGATSTT